MTIETVTIDSIQLDPANVRKHPTRNLEAIKASLTRFGQVKPIVVDNRGIVLAGNGTLTAARELGWSQINIVRTTLEGAMAVAFGIADNRTSETSEWDTEGLGNLLASLKAEDETLATAAGFTPDELAKLLGGESTEPQQETPPEDFPTYGEDIHTDFKCPKCAYQWSGAAK